MSDTQNTANAQSQQSKNPFEGFNPFAAFGQAFGQMNPFTSMKSAQDEAARLEQKALEMSRQAIDELARLAHATMAYAAQMSAEWRRLAFEGAGRVADLATSAQQPKPGQKA